MLSGKNSGVFVFVIEGEILAGCEKLFKGDSVEITGAEKIGLMAEEGSQVLLIEVPVEP